MFCFGTSLEGPRRTTETRPRFELRISRIQTPLEKKAASGNALHIVTLSARNTN